MNHGRAIAFVALWALLASASAGCGKKPVQKEGSPSGAMEPVGGGQHRRAPPRDGAMRTPPQSAAAACAEGARPDHGVSKEQFEVSVKTPRETKVGEAAEAEITVLPKAGYKINLKYPSELELKRGSEGLTLPRKSFEKAHAKELTEARLRFVVAFTTTSAGTKVAHGELGFSVCTPKICITEPDFCIAWEVTAR